MADAKINIDLFIKVNVDQFAGIEYKEFPVRIAETAMWLIDHQMNMKVSQEFGHYYVRLPLTKAAKIVHGNALRLDWEEVVPKENLNFILGNPPFIGKQLQNVEQKEDMDSVFTSVHGAGVLDYVSAWYLRAAEYIQDTKVRCAFVSTNSISQGEQVGVLWQELFNKYHLKIQFAHRTFSWSNEAKGNAAVHVVIIGFGLEDIESKRIFDYLNIKGEPHEIKARNINPYLVDAKDILIGSRSKPICSVAEMFKGSQPTDDGNLLLSDEEKREFLSLEPQAKQFIKPFISAKEFLHNQKRWCFWLVNVEPTELLKCPNLLKRIEKVKEFRLKSTKAATVKWAQMPGLFTENRQPTSMYILIPRHSSENRKYIPFGFFASENIIADSCNSIPNASLYHFGVLSSIMHMVWVKHICGRIKSDFRYSNDIVYNNFPWPEKPNEKQVILLESASQKVLDTRLEFSGSSLSELYNTLTMPQKLVKAHQELDKVVDLTYRSQQFTSDANRMVFLFELYEKYTNDLFSTEKLRETTVLSKSRTKKNN